MAEAEPDTPLLIRSGHPTSSGLSQEFENDVLAELEFWLEPLLARAYVAEIAMLYSPCVRAIRKCSGASELPSSFFYPQTSIVDEFCKIFGAEQ